MPRDVSEDSRRRMFQAEAELAIQQYKAERLRRVLQVEKEKETVCFLALLVIHNWGRY